MLAFVILIEIAKKIHIHDFNLTKKLRTHDCKEYTYIHDFNQTKKIHTHDFNQTGDSSYHFKRSRPDSIPSSFYTFGNYICPLKKSIFKGS